GRVIRVDLNNGVASLVNQFTITQQMRNPFPSGIAFVGGNAYVANGNQQTIFRVTSAVQMIAGLVTTNSQQVVQGVTCDYSGGGGCGDGGPASMATFNLVSSSIDPKANAIKGNPKQTGIVVADQGPTGRGRIRYINLSGGPVTLAGTTIPAGAIDTIAG